MSEHLAPGQWDYTRQPSRKELAATRLLALSLAEASVKVRSGPPTDSDSPDAALGLWAGELPLDTRWLQPVPDPALPAGLIAPPHIQSRAGNAGSSPLAASARPRHRPDWHAGATIRDQFAIKVVPQRRDPGGQTGYSAAQVNGPRPSGARMEPKCSRR